MLGFSYGHLIQASRQKVEIGWSGPRDRCIRGHDVVSPIVRYRNRQGRRRMTAETGKACITAAKDPKLSRR